jgi:ferric-dicitrate binding protein FerR (iron transport regulator)
VPDAADNHTPDDAARRLARQLGTVREQGDRLSDVSWADDAFVEAVREAVKARDADRQVAPTAAQSARMWRAIEAEIEPAPSLATRLQGHLNAARRAWGGRPILRWATAAAVLLIGGVVLWMLLWTSGPEPVAVAEGETVTYTTPGDATVRLRPHSALYRVPVDSARRYRLRGEAHFSVPSRPPTRAFEVQTDEATVRVLGTRFVVRAWTDSTEVYLEEGRVQVTAKARTRRSRLTLNAGQRAAVSPDGRIAPPAPAPRSRYLGWLDRTLTFEQRPLRSLVAELEYHYDLTLRVPERLLDQTLTGQIPLDDREQSLHDLAVVLGGRFDRIDDDTYRFVAP